MTRQATYSWIERIQAILLVLLMAAPFIQRTHRFFPEIKLHGVETPPPRPVLSVRSWFDGAYAPAAEAYLGFRIGGRALAVKLHNQIRYSLFRSVAGSSGTRITLGTNGWLYETEYVNKYLDRTGMDPPGGAGFVGNLRALQDELEKRGIVFALVVTPSKPEIVPEHLPNRVVARRAGNVAPNAYETLVPALKRAGVRVVDGHAYFKTLHAEGTPDLFARGGTHWTYAACFGFCRHLLETLQPLLPDRIRVPDLTDGARQQAQGTDRDLADLLNLFSCSPRHDQLPYPDFVGAALPMQERPDLLMVGDSFSFTMCDALNRARAIAGMDVLYYFKTLYAYPAEDIDTYFIRHTHLRSPPIDINQVDWRRFLLNKEIVLLEINEILLPEESWGFVDAALAFLRTSDAD